MNRYHVFFTYAGPSRFAGKTGRRVVRARDSQEAAARVSHRLSNMNRAIFVDWVKPLPGE